VAATERTILHVDMDAFYASVEQRDDPSLRGKPVIVGGDARRGVVLAASYEVRPFGVRSAMPMARAVKLAPKAIVVPPRPEAYAEASEKVFTIFESFTPLVEGLSLDEAFLDVTESRALFGHAREIAIKLRARIRAETGLPASAGLAENKFVAKIASDLAKPDGFKEVPFGTARAFLAPLPVSRLWGVGPKTEEQLLALGLKTIGDIAAKDAEWLSRKLGSGGDHFSHLSRGLDARAVESDRGAKSVGAEDTFGEDLEGEEALWPHIHLQALRVGRRLRRAGIKARTVQLKVKFADFEALTRRHTLDAATDDGQRLYREARALLSKLDLSKKVRLTGVSAQEILEEAPQLSLFGEEAPKKSDKLNQALDAIAGKFGSTAVMPADVKSGGEDDRREALRRNIGLAKADAEKEKKRR
jgi:DNA polymerase IV